MTTGGPGSLRNQAFYCRDRSRYCKEKCDGCLCSNFEHEIPVGGKAAGKKQFEEFMKSLFGAL